MTLSEHLGGGWGWDPLRARKANGATDAEQVAALTFTVTRKPWAGQECQLPALALLNQVLA